MIAVGTDGGAIHVRCKCRHFCDRADPQRLKEFVQEGRWLSFVAYTPTQLFNCTEKIIMPKAQFYNAHEENSEVTSVAFSRDKRRLISRASTRPPCRF
jgi:uncharacterized protein YeaC (DUF1315 family)